MRVGQVSLSRRSHKPESAGAEPAPATMSVLVRALVAIWVPESPHLIVHRTAKTQGLIMKLTRDMVDAEGRLHSTPEILDNFSSIISLGLADTLWKNIGGMDRETLEVFAFQLVKLYRKMCSDYMEIAEEDETI